MKTTELRNWLLAHGAALLSMVFAGCVWLFYGLGHAYVLSHLELLQMFQWTTDYFRERIVAPGGFAQYLGEGLVQFFRLPWLGGGLMALLLGGLQRACWVAGGRRWLPLSLVPAVLLWALMADVAVLPTYAVALLAAVAACCAVRTTLRGLVAQVLFIPVFHHLFGTTVYVFALYTALCWMGTPSVRRVGAALLVLGCTALAVWASTFYTPWPIGRIFQGIPYYIYAGATPATLLGLMGLTAVLCWAVRTLGGKVRGLKPGMEQGVAVAMVAVAACWVGGLYRSPLHHTLEYDAMVRAQQWEKILEKARADGAGSPMSVCCTDLALAAVGQLPAQLFAYPQNSPEGFFMGLPEDYLSIITVADIFYRIGMPSEALRYYYDAQESIPNYNKSSQLTARMAEIEIVNGQYDVARKYLNALARTTFYRRWAAERLALIAQGDKAVEAHPEYGTLRRYRLKEDYMFQPNLLFANLEALCRQCPDNQMAAQYLQATMMLSQQKQLMNNPQRRRMR